MRKYLTWGYLILICTILPLYMWQGYYELGESKGILYMGISSAFALLILLVENKRLFSDVHRECFVSYAGMALLFSNIISFICAMDKPVSFLGLKGWREGFLTVFLMLFFCQIFSVKLKFNMYILAAILITPVFECVMGILGRFGINLVEIYGSNVSFLGTIGNINWYVGFLAIFVPVFIGLCYTEKLFSKKFFVMALVEIVGLVALLTQGSESAILVIAGVFLLLVFKSLGNRKSFKRVLAQLFILGMSMEIVEALMIFFGSMYTYQNNLLITMCRGFTGLIMMAAAFFLYRLSRLFEEITATWRGSLFTKILMIALVILAAAGVYWCVQNVDYNFGNGRGLIWSLSIDMFKSLTPWRKLVGVGQDGFCGYAYSNPEIADSLVRLFPGNVLTNAHCEVLTILIERGILGVSTYLLFIGAVIWEFIRNKKERAATICALPVIAYFLNSLVSFPTVTSTPYMLIAIGIGLSSCEEVSGE